MDLNAAYYLARKLSKHEKVPQSVLNAPEALILLLKETNRMRLMYSYSDDYIINTLGKILGYPVVDNYCDVKDKTPEDLCLEAFNLIERLRTALADAINRPMGVVPNSAEGLVTDEDLVEAEKRRPRNRVSL